MRKFNRDWPRQNRVDPAAWLDAILTWGQAEYFSDFYFVAQGKRYRLTGKQQEELFFLDELAIDFAKRVLLVIKYRAALNLTEDRRPQLGRFDFQSGFIRVSTVGDFLDRESLVLRLIYPHLGEWSWHFPSQRHDLVTQKIENGLLAVALAQSAQQGLGKGESLTEWLGRQPFLQPTLAAYFNRGLPSQDLGTYLTFYAQGEYRQFERQMSSLLALVQPIFFGLIGLTIVLLYLAMLLPLYRNLGGVVS